MLPQSLLNSRLLRIERPVRGGLGGGIQGYTTVLSIVDGTSFNAIHEATQDLVRSENGAEIQLEGRLYVDDEALAAVRNGDLVTFRDRLGRTRTRAEIATLELAGGPNHLLSHWELGLRAGVLT